MKALDLTGQRFGRWTVVCVVDDQGPRRWHLRCECGNNGVSTAGGLRHGQTMSCGCAVIDTPWSGEDLAGRVFGRLTAVSRTTGKGAMRTLWRCMCQCGRQTNSSSDSLISGKSTSCGCSRIKHGHLAGDAKTPEYAAWSNMMRRCCDSRRKDFDNYGGRGIYVCNGWQNPSVFLDDMGRRTSRRHSLDRINNDGSYTCGKCDDCIVKGAPANCRWATAKEQASNKRTNRTITVDGVTKTATDWSRYVGLSDSFVAGRLKRGWDQVRAVVVPPMVTKYGC